MWDERYATQEYVYGTEPNRFLVEQASLLQSPVLSLAEGEGRNAVYLARQGLDVLGVDSSQVGLAKAHRLAAEHGVTLRSEVVDLAVYTPPPNTFGSVVSIFAHVPSAVRKRLYPRVVKALLPNGIIVLEAYAKAQIGRGTGGPKDPDLLLTADELAEDFTGLEVLLCREIEREVVEGSLHTGMASVVQLVARKPVQ